MSPDELREWFEEYLEVCNRHDLVEMRNLIAPTVRRAHLPGGADAWIADLEELFAGFPDFRWKRVNVVAEGSQLAAHLRGSGTHRGTYRGVRPTGAHVNVAEFAIYRIVNGQITEYAGTADGDSLLERGS